MKNVTLISLLALCAALSGCVVAPARPVAYYPVAPVYYATCYHCWR
jgi:hypothetical protein